MKYCYNCCKELLDDMQFCPSCGAPVQTAVDNSRMDKAVYAGEAVPKKKHKGMIALIIVLALVALLVAAWFLYANMAKVNTYNQFAELYNKMAEGAAKAETANILIMDVWQNSIFNTDDVRTDKYTKTDNGSGQFYEDFNDALISLYDDPAFTDDLAEIYKLQTEAETLIKDLAKHPKPFDDEYTDFKDCYNMFVIFTDMSLDARGSLNSFTDDHNEIDQKLADKLKELNIYFD